METEREATEKVLLNTNHFIGSVKGIAGSSITGIEANWGR